MRVERHGDRIYLVGTRKEIDKIDMEIGGVCRWTSGAGFPVDPAIILMLLSLNEDWIQIDPQLVKWAQAWVAEVKTLNDNFGLCTPVEEVIAADGARLWVHQASDAAILAKRRKGILAYKVGLGKTATAVEVCRRAKAKKVLVVVAKTLILAGHWTREFERWYPGSRVVEAVGGTVAKKRVLSDVLRSSGSGSVSGSGGGCVVVLTNYEAFREEEIVDLLTDWGPQVLIMDEAHRLRSWRGGGAQFSKGIVQLVRDLGLGERGWVLALTGTPVVNSEADVWGILRILDWNRYGTGGFWSWASRWFDVAEGPFGREIVGVKHKYEKLWSFALSEFMVRRTAEEVGLWLPDKVEERIDVNLEDWERIAYKKFEKELYLELEDLHVGSEGVVFAANLLTRQIRLRQLALDPRLLVNVAVGEGECTEGERTNGDFSLRTPFEKGTRVEAGAKTKAIVELVKHILGVDDEIQHPKENDEKIVIFTVFRDHARILEEELRVPLGGRVVRVSGDMSNEERAAALEAFLRGECSEKEKGKGKEKESGGSSGGRGGESRGGSREEGRGESRGESGGKRGARVLVATVGVAGEGLNLQESGAGWVIFAAEPWTQMEIEQAIGRVHRAGAKVSTVQVRYVIAKGTVEEHVWQVVREKGRTATEQDVALEVWRWRRRAEFVTGSGA